MGGAPESSVGATRRSLVPPFNNWSDLAGDEGGRRGGCGPGRRAKGGGGVGGVGQGGGQGGVDGGGAPESSVGATRRCSTFLKPNNWSDLAGDEGGRRGGCGPGRRARGGRLGGAPESSVGATRRSLVPPFGFGLIWLVTRGGGVGGVGQGGGQGGVDGGGTREQRGSNKAFTGSTFWAPGW